MRWRPRSFGIRGSGCSSMPKAAPTRVDAMRLAALIGRLAPDTAVHPIASSGTSGLAEVIREDPPLLPTTAAGGRTQWALPERLELDAERLRGWAEQGDGAVLVVGAVGIEAPIWRQLSSAAVGSCEPLLAALLDGQAQSLALLEPFLDHADAVLASLYAAELATVVPQLQAELAEFERERPRKDFDLGRLGALPVWPSVSPVFAAVRRLCIGRAKPRLCEHATTVLAWVGADRFGRAQRLRSDRLSASTRS